MAYKLYRGSSVDGTLENIARVVGTLTISSDGRSWTGFNEQNFLTLKNPINIGKNDYEFYFYVHLKDSSKSFQILVDYYPRSRFSIGFWKSDKGWVIHTNTAPDGVNWGSGLNGTTVLSVNKNYHVICRRVNGVRYIYYREDTPGAAWHLEGSIADTTDLPLSNYRIGKSLDNNLYQFTGFINMSSYIRATTVDLIKKVYFGGGVGFRVADNYQKFGSPTQDGWNFAGFSANNYLRLNKPVDIGANNYDIKFQFALGDSNEEYQVLCNCDIGGLFAFAILKTDNKFFLHSNSGDGTNWNRRLNGTTPLTVGQVYAARLVKRGGIRYMYLSPGGGENWQLQGSIADPSTASSGNLWIGRDMVGGQIFNGVIDIGRSTITIDGNLNIKKIYRGNQLVWQE